jgi:hypothetical protein
MLPIFSGGPYSAQVVSPYGGENWHPGEQRDISWNASIGADSTTLINVFLDRNGGNGGYPEKIVDSIPGAYYSGWTWTVTSPYSTHCRIKVVAYDIAGNYAEDISNKDFIISDSGNNDPVVEGPLRCMYPQDECEDCVKYTEQVTVEVSAYDPDGDSIWYEWYTGHGYFVENGQNTITTTQNFVTYVAPAKGKGTLFDDWISVGVTDVRGGQGWMLGRPELHNQDYPCMCSDFNDDASVDVGDVTFLLNYLYKYGLP